MLIQISNIQFQVGLPSDEDIKELSPNIEIDKHQSNFNQKNIV